jgi:hypothetical protein
MKYKLLPCPFCGGVPRKTTKSLDERFGYADEVTIRCGSCSCAKSAVGDTSKSGYADNSTVEKRAVEAWNTRYTQTTKEI